jgi:GH24 family phage-related lysozyme (muramidase)
LECYSEALTGSGPGFKSSQEESEEAAKANWLEKAKAIYLDADWASAKEPLMQCVKQGLYSKCFATGFPCRPKPE